MTKKTRSDIHLVLSLGSGSIVSHRSSRWFCSCLGNRGGSTSKIYGNFINAFLFMLWVFFWRKSSQEHLTRSQTTYDRRSPVCESESYDRAEFRRLRTQNWGSGWLLGLMEVRRDWYGSHTSYNLKGLKLCTIDFKNNTDSLILCMIFFKSGLQLIANACDLKYSYPRPTSLSLNAINILQVDFMGETERNADKYKKSENRGWKLCTEIKGPALAAMRRGTPLL